MYLKKCEYCGKEFLINRKEQKCCSEMCGHKNRYKKEDEGIFGNDNISKEVKAYILGLIVTDGCISRTNNSGESFRITISSIDGYLMEQIRLLACKNKKLYRDGNNYQVKWRNTFDVQYLKSLNINERKSSNVPFPNIDEDFIWHLIRGIFDGNGCIYYSKTYFKEDYYLYKYISFTTGSFVFAEGLKYIFDKYNILSHIYKEKKSNCFYVKIFRSQDVKQFYQLIYKDSENWKIIRKYNKF
jgi:hypothetical protein